MLPGGAPNADTIEVATEVTYSERTLQPYIDIGLIVVTWSDGSSTLGTCAIVGRNDILTAGHAVYNPDKGGWAIGFDFYFGTDYNSVTGVYEQIISHPSYSRWSATAWPSSIYSDGNNSTMSLMSVPKNLT